MAIRQILKRMRAWLAKRRQAEAAVQRALDQFQRSRGIKPMGGFALYLDSHETIVRVMYLTDHIPPDRAWFAVAVDTATIRELSFDEVEHLETPWR